MSFYLFHPNIVCEKNRVCDEGLKEYFFRKNLPVTIVSIYLHLIIRECSEHFCWHSYAYKNSLVVERKHFFVEDLFLVRLLINTTTSSLVEAFYLFSFIYHDLQLQQKNCIILDLFLLTPTLSFDKEIANLK